MTRHILSAACVPSASPKYSIDDLRWTSVRECRSIGTGRFYRTAKGGQKEELAEKEYVRTAAAGTLELNVWCRLMEDAVEHEGKRELLGRITEHCRRHCAWLRQEKKLLEYALECLSSEAYKAWNDFGEEKE